MPIVVMSMIPTVSASHVAYCCAIRTDGVAVGILLETLAACAMVPDASMTLIRQRGTGASARRLIPQEIYLFKAGYRSRVSSALHPLQCRPQKSGERDTSLVLKVRRLQRRRTAAVKG